MHNNFYLLKHYLYSAKRNKGRLLDILLWPMIEIYVFGLTSNYLGKLGESDFLALIVINLIYWHFFSRISNEMFQQVFDDVVSKNMSNIFLIPISRVRLVCVWILAALIKFLVGMIVMTCGVWLMFKLRITNLSFDWFLMIVVILVNGMGVGLAVVSLLFVIGTKALAFGWMLTGLMQPLSCVFYSRQALGSVLSKLSYLIPISYVFENERMKILGEGINSGLLYLPIVLSSVYLLLGLCLLEISINYSRRRGILMGL